MLDTVRLWLPNFGIHGLDDEKWTTTSLCGVYRLRSEVLAPGLGHVRVNFNEWRSSLNVELSLSRLIHGHNRGSVSEGDVAECIELMDALVAWSLTDRALHSLVVFPLPSVAAWNLTRVDTFFDFRSSKFPPDVVHRALMRLQPSGRWNVNRVNDETAYFRGPSRRKREEIAIYNKAKESRVPAAAGLSRIEVRLFGSAKIKEGFGTASARLHDVGVPSRCRRVLLRSLAKLHVRPDEAADVTSYDELVVRTGPLKARRLWPYMQLRSDHPRARACELLGVTQETGRRYERELRKLGLYPAAVEVGGVHEELLEALVASFGAAPSRAMGGPETARYLQAPQGERRSA